MKLNLAQYTTGFVIGLIVFSIIFGSWYTVSAGERGILTTFNKPVSVSGEGLHFKIPIVQGVVKMNLRTQKFEADAGAASKDLQVVSSKLALNYHVSEASLMPLYREFGKDYEALFVQPALQEVVKASTSQFTAEELITKRSEVKEKMVVGLRDRFALRGIVVEDINIVDFDFSEEFNKAIEQKVTAEQNALAAKNKLEQVKFEAEQRITQANAEAEAIKIQAQAIQSQGGESYVQLQAINKWNGVLPGVTGGVVPFINVQAGVSQ